MQDSSWFLSLWGLADQSCQSDWNSKRASCIKRCLKKVNKRWGWSESLLRAKTTRRKSSVRCWRRKWRSDDRPGKKQMEKIMDSRWNASSVWIALTTSLFVTLKESALSLRLWTITQYWPDGDCWKANNCNQSCNQMNLWFLDTIVFQHWFLRGSQSKTCT